MTDYTPEQRAEAQALIDREGWTRDCHYRRPYDTPVRCCECGEPLDRASKKVPLTPAEVLAVSPAGRPLCDPLWAAFGEAKGDLIRRRTDGAIAAAVPDSRAIFDAHTAHTAPLAMVRALLAVPK